VIYERDSYISYGTCGLPYFLSGEIKDINRLIVNTEKRFEKRFNAEVNTLHEVTGIEPDKRIVHVKNLKTGISFNDNFDNLIITTGSVPVILKFNGKLPKNIFTLKTIDDAINLKKCMDKLDRKDGIKNVAVIGGGFAGLELLDAFLGRGYKVSIIEKASQILPMFDGEMIEYLDNYLEEKKVNIYREDEVIDLTLVSSGNAISLKTLAGRTLETDIIFFSIGVRPNIKLARDSGIKIGKSGSIAVDEFMRTNFKYIYTAGDCCECRNLVSGEKRPYNLASIASRQGRAAGYNAAGGSKKFSGSTVTSIVKVLDVAVVKTGLSLKEAAGIGINADFIENHYPSHSGYYPGSNMIHMMIVFNRDNGSLLGFQALGKSGVDKKVDIISTAIRGNLKIQELTGLDLGYQPAYGSVKDLINILGMIGENQAEDEVEFISIKDFKEKIKKNEDMTVLDVRTKREYENGHIEGSLLIYINELRSSLEKLDKDDQIILYCETGYRAYLALRILKNKGFKNVKLLNGSYLSWERKI
jgi:NADPH-dependent 2,4-dienoyl-CoA reductase/sulfur reductase-like enzyme/rhodanese-related sulfurtransferase